MAEPEPELTLSELDRLEDALETLEDDGAANSHDLADVVRSRLDDYRAVLQIAREAWPDEPLRDGVLDEVMAEARRAAPHAPGRERSSSRMRNWLVPVLALGVTAGLVLFVARPNADLDASLEKPNAAAPADAAAEPPATPGTNATTAAPVEEIERKREDLADLEASTEPKKDGERRPAPRLEDAKPQSAKKGASVPGGVPGKAMEAAAPPAPSEKDARWQAIEDADRLRNRGACSEAMRMYEPLMDGGAFDSRARAGYGLCLELEGKDASTYYGEDQAEFVAAERAKMNDFAPAQTKKAAKAKNSKVQAIEQADAFQD